MDNENLKDITENTKKTTTVFFLFLFYVLIAIANISDLQLLNPQNKVKLAILDIDLTFSQFYIIAPILIIGFHFFILFELINHRSKLNKIEENGNEEIITKYPFVFNFLIAEKSWLHIPLTVLVWIYGFLPPIVLLIFQIHFAKLHIENYTFMHFVFVTIDIILLLAFWFRIIWSKKNAEYFSKEAKASQSKKLKSLYFKFRSNKIITHVIICMLSLCFVILSLSCYCSIKNIDKKNKQPVFLNVFPLYLELKNQVITGSTVELENMLPDSTILKNNYNVAFDLSDKNLQFINLQNSVLINVNLKGANLNYANLFNAKFEDVDLRSVSDSCIDASFLKLNNCKINDTTIFQKSKETIELKITNPVIYEKAD